MPQIHDPTRAVPTATPAAGSEPGSPSPPAEWWVDRALAERLYALVERLDLSGAAFADMLAALVQEHGDAVYAELIFLLTRLRLDPAAAREHWPAVLRRQAQLASQAGAAADVRVALLSHFLEVDRQFERPKVVEMGWAEWTAASALLDDVTGLPNQRFYRAECHREVERSLRENSPLSLAVFDIDDFKRINDLLGHDGGTSALAGLAAVLRDTARPSDMVSRYGGDEFVVLFPATPKAEAAQFAEDLRLAAHAYQIRPPDGSAPFSVTMSGGVATCPGDGRDGAALFSAADQALFQAKKAGKDRVCLFAESTRSYARRKVAWPVHVVPVGDMGFAGQTTEVGEGGFSFRSDREFPLGSLVEATIIMPDGDVLRRAGRVVWVHGEAAPLPLIAVRFVEPGGDDRRRLAKWVRSP